MTFLSRVNCADVSSGLARFHDRQEFFLSALIDRGQDTLRVHGHIARNACSQLRQQERKYLLAVFLVRRGHTVPAFSRPTRR